MSPNPVTPLNIAPLHIVDTALRLKASINLDNEVKEELTKENAIEKTVAELIDEYKPSHL